MPKMYSLKDTKAQAFSMPMYHKTHGESERFIRTILGEDPKQLPGFYQNLAKYPQDFDLYYLGEFDELSGKIELLDAPQHMINCDQLKSVQN